MGSEDRAGTPSRWRQRRPQMISSRAPGKAVVLGPPEVLAAQAGFKARKALLRCCAIAGETSIRLACASGVECGFCVSVRSSLHVGKPPTQLWQVGQRAEHLPPSSAGQTPARPEPPAALLDLCRNVRPLKKQVQPLAVQCSANCLEGLPSARISCAHGAPMC